MCERGCVCVCVCVCVGVCVCVCVQSLVPRETPSVVYMKIHVYV